MFGVAGNGAAGIVLTSGTNIIDNQAGGVIRGGSGVLAGDGIIIRSGATVDITNLGLISAGVVGTSGYGINNLGTVTRLINAQGGTASSALTYKGNLPVNYTLVLNSQASYGQLAMTDAGGLTTVSAITDMGTGLSTQKFSNVITGVMGDLITNYGASHAFTLANGVIGMLGSANDSDWDLGVLNFGQDLAESQRTKLEQRNYAVRFGLGYNCSNFGSNGVCVSFQANKMQSNLQGETAGVLIGAKRLNDNLQVGLFREAGHSGGNGVQVGNGQPLTGAFLNFAANADGTGLQGRVSYASQISKATLTRANILGTADTVTGSADMKASGTEVKLGWGFALPSNHILIPFVSFTSSKATRLSYSEASATGVDAPFSYSDFKLNRTATTAGIDLKGLLKEGLTYRVSVGAEQSSNKLNDFELAGTFGKATYTPASLSSNGLGYNASAGLNYKVSDKISVHVNASVRKQESSSEAVTFVSTGLHFGF